MDVCEDVSASQWSVVIHYRRRKTVSDPKKRDVSNVEISDLLGQRRDGTQRIDRSRYCRVVE
jgi:hypothetical protein